MQRRTQKTRLGVLFLLLGFALCSLLVWLTYRMVRQGQLNQALIAAIKQGDTNTVLSLLDAGADPNATDHAEAPVSFWQQFLLPFRRLFGQPVPPPVKGERALFLALSAQQLQPALVLALLSKGADAHARDRAGDTALLALVAVRSLPEAPDLTVDPPENPLLVQALLDKGVDINARNDQGITALMISCLNGWTKTVGILLAKKADANVVSPCFIGTALLIAVVFRHTDIVKMLIENGANVNLADSTGATPMVCAKQFRPLFRLLKAAGARE